MVPLLLLLLVVVQLVVLEAEVGCAMQSQLFKASRVTITLVTLG